MNQIPGPPHTQAFIHMQVQSETAPRTPCGQLRLERDDLVIGIQQVRGRQTLYHQRANFQKATFQVCICPVTFKTGKDFIVFTQENET